LAALPLHWRVTCCRLDRRHSAMTYTKKYIGAGVFALLILFGAIASLQALPNGNQGFDNIYYSDATYTTQVGERYM
jgi:hypothetical protein